jgi:Uncharacterized protein conserved in bacteria
MKKRFLPVVMLVIVAVSSSMFPVYAAEEQETPMMSETELKDDSVKDMSTMMISLAVDSQPVKEVKADIAAKEKAEREAKAKAAREAKEKAEREAKEQAEREAREQAAREQEAKEQEQQAASTSAAPSGRTMMMEATAYSSDPADAMGGGTVTATGQNLLSNPMAVAVDPSVIPLGTRLYVEGYGEAIASDTGGAIQGNIIDVHFPTYDQCVQWGRRQVQVTILD